MTWPFTGRAKGYALAAALCLAANLCWGAGMDTSDSATFPQLEQIRAAAASGEPNAQFKMGDYWYSRGAFTNAVSWYQLAADQGHRGAQISLASCYLQGRGISKDLQLAAKWSAQARGELNNGPVAARVSTASPEVTEPAPSKEPTRTHHSRGLERVPPELESIALQLQSYTRETQAEPHSK